MSNDIVDPVDRVAKFMYVGDLIPDLVRTENTVRLTALKFPKRKFYSYVNPVYLTDITIPLVGEDRIVFRRFNTQNTKMTMKYVHPTTHEEHTMNLGDLEVGFPGPEFEYDAIVIDLTDNGDQYKGDFYFFDRENDNVVAHMKFIPSGTRTHQSDSIWLLSETGGAPMFQIQH